MNQQTKMRHVDNWTPKASTLVFRQSHRGLVISNADNLRSIEFLEISAKVVGISMPIFGAILFLLGSSVGLDGFASRTGALAFSVAFGWFAYSFGSKGLITEVEIDDLQREIRTGSRNASGKYVSTRTYSLDEIVSVFIRRSKNREAVVTLNIRLKRDQSTQIRILRGTEAALIPVLNYIVELHTSKAKAVKKPRTRTTGRFIAADLI